MNTKLGYYQVNDGQIFADKIAAMLHASSVNQRIAWHFLDEVFDKVDWTSEPELNLDQFYKIRAQQIRDEFDYVVVLVSGGGDSANVAQSFLKNNIHIDEIIASAPMSGLSLWQDNANDNSAQNTMSETILAQLPLINEIKQLYPNTKITLNDYFKTIIEYKTDEWLYRSGEWIHPSSAARYDFTNLTHLRNLAESGKKIGIVYGIDKPNLLIDTEYNIRINFADLAVNVQRPAFDDKYPNVENVLFYWTRDLPLMLVKQAHVLARQIFRKENINIKNLMYNINVPPLTAYDNRMRQSTYERAIIPCIYPSLNRTVFQGHKPIKMFLGEHDDWFYKLHNKTRMYELISSDFKNFIKGIDKRCLNADSSGFKIFFKTFVIGPITKFEVDLIDVSL